MPEEIQPPQTIPEIGIHLVYMSKSINEVQATLKEMKEGSITRKEFDERVVHCDERYEDHENRIVTIEKKLMVEDQSTMRKVFKQLDAKIVSLIAAALLGAFLYTVYLSARYNSIINSLPEVEVVNK